MENTYDSNRKHIPVVPWLVPSTQQQQSNACKVHLRQSRRRRGHGRGSANGAGHARRRGARRKAGARRRQRGSLQSQTQRSLQHCSKGRCQHPSERMSGAHCTCLGHQADGASQISSKLLSFRVCRAWPGGVQYEQRCTCRGTGLLPGMAPPAPGAVGFTGVMSPGAIDVTCQCTCGFYVFPMVELPGCGPHSWMHAVRSDMCGRHGGMTAGCPPQERCWSRRRGTWM